MQLLYQPDCSMRLSQIAACAWLEISTSRHCGTSLLSSLPPTLFVWILEIENDRGFCRRPPYSKVSVPDFVGFFSPYPLIYLTLGCSVVQKIRHSACLVSCLKFESWDHTPIWLVWVSEVKLELNLELETQNWENNFEADPWFCEVQDFNLGSDFKLWVEVELRIDLGSSSTKWPFWVWAEDCYSECSKAESRATR